LNSLPNMIKAKNSTREYRNSLSLFSFFFQRYIKKMLVYMSKKKIETVYDKEFKPEKETIPQKQTISQKETVYDKEFKPEKETIPQKQTKTP
jgi:hypothetical protein